ncbi:EpsT [Leadbettera azotonutricia ZAS-9]|uniref:EpsT n=2 Tax=Leadbettera azotonutricia TaxID=150829 RepID=F5YAK3_LEAAZ|nr:EpsT [Leadbettera azotonutricia ZAS-9]
MLFNKKKNAFRGIFWGLIHNFVSIILPFVIRTVIIGTIGIKYIGLGSLFAGLLGVLSLAELGFGSAISFCFYKPIADNDTNKINALLNFLKKSYRIIGVIIFFCGILLLPFLKTLISGDCPDNINVYILFLIYLSNTSISYFLFAYKKILLIVHQRYDIEVKISTLVLFIQSILQLVILMLFRNYYYFILILPAMTIFNNIVSAFLVKKLFPQYFCFGKLDDVSISDIVKKVKGVFCYKIGSTVLFSVDSIVISIFLGLEILGKFNNYYIIVYSLFAIQAVIQNSIRPIISSCIAMESIGKNYSDFNKFNFLYMWISFSFSVCCLCLYQNFIELWLGNSYLLPNSIVFLLVVSFYSQSCCHLLRIYQEASGLFFEGKFVPLIAAAFNLVMNIILVNIIGLPGVIISTIASVMFILLPGYAFVLFKYYFKEINKLKQQIMYYIKYITISFILGILLFYLCNAIDGKGIIEFLIKILISVLIPNILYYIIFIKDPNCRNSISFLLKKRNAK